MLNHKKILIFGGTFDPPHLGHLNLCLAAIDKVKPDHVIIVPNKTQPIKNEQSQTSASDRYEMCELCFRFVPNVEISDYEISHIGKSYTYKTIKHFLEIYPHDELFFLIGTDRINDFTTWKNYEYIMDNVTLLGSVRSTSDKILNSFSGIIIDNYQPINITSSQLRVEPNKQYLTPLVARFIATKGIYCPEQVKPLMSDYRYQHTLRVVDTAKKIANANHYPYPYKVYVAAMYHDIGKEMNEKQILSLVKTYDHHRYPTIHTLHGIASSIYAQQHFNITDQEVIDAIANHVVPPKECTTLDKIIYLADKLEPSRTNEQVPNRKKILKLAYKDVNQAFNVLVKTMNDKYNSPEWKDKHANK